MEMLKEYSEKYGLKEVVNDYGEHRQTRERSISFKFLNDKERIYR